MSNIVNLLIEQITQDPEIQIRATSIDWLIVDAYLESANQGASFPPVVVFFDGDNYWLADGNHRLEVARRIGKTEISADVRDGGKREAILYAVGANDNHGLRRTNADKRNAVMRLLSDAEWMQWSDREIARQCKVDKNVVSRLRDDLSGAKHQIQSPRMATRNGAIYTINTNNIGNNIGKQSESKPEVPQVSLLDTKPVPASIIEQPLPALTAEINQDTEPVIEEIAAIVALESELASIKPAYTVNIINADSQYLSQKVEMPVHLVITSPPYNVGIDYADSSDDLLTYIPLITTVWCECYKVMVDGARIAVVVPFGMGRNPYIPFDCQVMQTLIDAGFQLRGRIVWDKNTTGNRTSWGSFRLPSDPSIRDTTECIIVAHKGQSKLELPSEVKLKDSKGTYTEWLADVDDFMGMAQDHWVIAPESAQRVGHPAPFPVELAKRLIRFYAYPGAHILDPFGGSGTVGVAAQELGCNATLIEVSQQYCELAKGRLH